MLKRASLILAAAIVVFGASPAFADRCSGRNHNTGAVGGGLVGSAITHGSAVGVVGGAVAGGLAGNAIERDQDCRRPQARKHRHKVYYYDRHHNRHYRWEYDRRN